MRYYKTKAAVPLQQGQTLGFKGGKGGGYFARGKPLSDQAYVTSQIDTVLGPIIGDLRAQGKLTSSNLGGVYNALADQQAQVAPAIQQTYQNATANTAAFGKGYSDALKAQLGDAAAQSNVILAQNGSPQQVGDGAGAADVLFGLGGSIPGQALAREGAAFTAAAQQLPATARGVGAQQQAQAIHEMNAQIAKIEAEKPGLIQKALADLQQSRFDQQEFELKQALAQQAYGLDVARLDLAGRKQEFSEAETKVKLNQSALRLTLDQQRLQNEGQRVKLSASQQKFNKLLSLAKLDLSQDNYDLAVQKEKRMAQTQKKGGFTAKEIRDFRAIAYDSVNEKFNVLPPKVVLRDLINHGIPFSIAIKAIQDAARRPGASPYWKATLKWTRK